MRVTEREKLEKDLQLLIFTRQKLGEIRAAATGRRLTATMVRLRMSRQISLIDEKIGSKKNEISAEEIRERLGEAGGGTYDTGAVAGYGTDDGETDNRNDSGDDGRHAADCEQGRVRDAGGETGTREEPGRLDAVQRLAAGKDPGAGGSERELRRRYRERHPAPELKDWQREIMERDLRGEHEEANNL